MGTAALLGAGLALSAATSFAQINQANQQSALVADAAKAENDAAYETGLRNLQDQSLEIDRQAAIVDRQAKEAKRDSGRSARAESAILRVAFGEVGGALESNSAQSYLDTESYLFGQDMALIEQGRQETLDSLTQHKRNASQNFMDTVNAANLNANISTANANLQASQAVTSGFLNFLNSGLSAYNKHSYQQQMLGAARGGPSQTGGAVPIPKPKP